jgi:3-oxoacyl-[acyl-carrier protein] reductase
MTLKDKVAIITGASRGIGRRIAEVFADNGASIVINYLQADNEAQMVMESIYSHTGIKALVVKADISTSSGVSSLVDAVMQHFGHVDILVNNAGMTIRGSLFDITEEKWDRVLDVNLKGPFLCSKAVAERMLKEKQGVIINIASIRGLTGSSSSLHYAVAKAGVIALTKSLALELAPHIRVNAIAPGYTHTELHAHLSQEEIRRIESTIPLKRFGMVDDIANAALFLASDQSSYITGETIVVSGGLVIR